MQLRFTAPLWLYRAEGAWHFITLPPDAADEIADAAGPERRGFGSVRVTVTIGATTWQTSVFPDKASSSYVLPVKKPVRMAEHIEDGDLVDVTLEPIGA